jgi:hypothetical protein
VGDKRRKMDKSLAICCRYCHSQRTARTVLVSLTVRPHASLKQRSSIACAMLEASQGLSAVLVCLLCWLRNVGRGFGRGCGLRLRMVLMRSSRMIFPKGSPANAFLLILWSGGISYVRPFFPPLARKDRVPGDPGFWRNGRVEFCFLACTISKNAIANDPTAGFVVQGSSTKRCGWRGS